MPLALALISVSNPRLNILDTLSKFSHDADPEVSYNSIFAMGMVGSGKAPGTVQEGTGGMGGVVTVVSAAGCWSSRALFQPSFAYLFLISRAPVPAGSHWADAAISSHCWGWVLPRVEWQLSLSMCACSCTALGPLTSGYTAQSPGRPHSGSLVGEVVGMCLASGTQAGACSLFLASCSPLVPVQAPTMPGWQRC